MNEVWKDIAGWEGKYQVSNLGRIRSVDRTISPKNGEWKPYLIRGRVLKTPPDDHGYLQCNLCRNGKNHHVKVHVVVAAAFLGPRPAGLDVCHRNGIKSDCAETNLRYGTRSSNQNDRVEHGTSNRGERCAASKLTQEQVIAIRERKAAGGISYRELGEEYGVSYSTIYDVVAGRKWGWLR